MSGAYTSIFPKGSRWTPAKLFAIRECLKQGLGLSSAGSLIGHTAHECDHALWTLVGRTPTQACDLLNGVRP